jgi:hypothetical protein
MESRDRVKKIPKCAEESNDLSMMKEMLSCAETGRREY